MGGGHGENVRKCIDLAENHLHTHYLFVDVQPDNGTCGSMCMVFTVK